jgi:excisionase family DNA binding protein
MTQEINITQQRPLTTKEACVFLRCKPTWLWNMAKRGKVKRIKAGGKVLFFKEDLIYFLKNNIER